TMSARLAVSWPASSSATSSGGTWSSCSTPGSARARSSRMPGSYAESDSDQRGSHRLHRGVEREDGAEEAARDHEARHQGVDAGDERGRHLAAALVGGELVQLLLRRQEPDPVACARGDRAQDEKSDRATRPRGDDCAETEREQDATERLVASM